MISYYAEIKKGVVLNIIWSEDTETPMSENDIVKIDEGQAVLGDLYDGDVFTTPPDTRTYSELRAEAYPSLQEQADMAYWDRQNGTTTLDDAITAVKEQYPKG